MDRFLFFLLHACGRNVRAYAPVDFAQDVLVVRIVAADPANVNNTLVNPLDQTIRFILIFSACVYSLV